MTLAPSPIPPSQTGWIVTSLTGRQYVLHERSNVEQCSKEGWIIEPHNPEKLP